MGNKTQQVQLLFHRRTARSRGPTSSNAMNDMMDEAAHDLSVIQSELNNSLVPAMSGLPNGSPDTAVDAFVNGLDGKNLYTSATATDILDPLHYNTLASRPRTVYEQFANVYDAISGLEVHLETQLGAFAATAQSVTIADTGGLYISGNVEAALAEVAEKVNLVALGQVDLSTINTHYVPATTDLFDIGTSSVYLRDVYTTKLDLKPTTVPTALEGRVYYDSVDKVLYFYDGTTWLQVATV